MLTTATDVSFPGFGINFTFTRTYRGRTHFFGPLGHNWDHRYDQRLFGDDVGHAYCDGSIDFQNGRLGVVHFTPLKTNIIRTVANTLVSSLARISSPVPLVPHSLIVTAPVLNPGVSTILNPPIAIPSGSPGIPVIPPPANTNTHIDYAAGNGSTLTLAYDSSHLYPWTMTDLNGVTSLFDNDGQLAFIQHPAGPSLTFTWANKHLTKIVDTTGRTIYLNYESSGKFLQCLSLDTTCNKPLVSYGVDNVPLLAPKCVKPMVCRRNPSPSYGELVSVLPGDGTSREGLVQYVYFHGVQTDAYVGDEDAKTLCASECSARTTTQCRNDDVCHFNACATIGGSDATAAKTACDKYCHANCWATCKGNGCTKQCDSQCTGFCESLPSAAQACYQNLPSFCSASDCQSACVAAFIYPPNPGQAAHQYHFGSLSDLNHDLVQIIDNSGRTVISNKYGTDATDASFDKVVDQQVGELDIPENHVTWEYHDLKLEDDFGASSPSKPDSALVVPLRSFVSQNICPVSCGPTGSSCTSARWQYAAAQSEPLQIGDVTQTVHQYPRYATVVHELGGIIKVSYYDENWTLLRQVNQTNGEQTDFNYDSNGYLIGQSNPAGDRVCRALQGALPVQVTKLPAPGFSGSQDPIVTTYAYDSAHQITDVVTDPDGTNIRVHYQRDVYERVIYIDKSIDSNTTERTTLAYDDKMPVPKSVTSPGGAVTTYANFDPVGAAPQMVSVGADGNAPIQTYAVFDGNGRVQEAGKPNLTAFRYQYSNTGRVTVQSRRYDAKSPWIDTTSNLASRSLQPLTTTGPRVKTTVYTNSQGDPVWKTEQPVDGSLPARTTCFHYDGEGHLLETILPEGNSIINTYDKSWRLTQATKGMRGTAPTDAWAAQCASNTTNWSGPSASVVTEYLPGGFIKAKTVDGIRTWFVTDGFGRPIEDHDAAGGVRRRGYDRQGRVAWEALMQPSVAAAAYAKPQPDASQVVTMTEYTYDHLGRTTTVTRWHVEDRTPVVTTTAYSDTQRSVTVNDAGLVTTTVVDGAGRPVVKTLPDGSTIKWAYSGDSGSIITKTTQRNNPNKPYTTETTTLDGMGFAASVVDDLSTLEHAESHDIEGHLTTTMDLAGNAVSLFGYDGFGRLQRESKKFISVAPPLTAQATVVATYGYDRNDRRTTIADARGNTTSFNFDAVDRVSTKVDPFGRSTAFAYDGASTRILTQTDPSGTTFNRTYTALGLPLTEVTNPGSGLDVGVRQTSFGYDLAGHLNRVDYSGPGLQGLGNTVTLQFDSLGRKVQESNSLFSFGINHTYDLAGRWKTTTIAGSTQQQSFDALGRLAGVSLNGSSLAVYHYGAAGVGGPLEIDYSTGARTTFAYDQRNRQTDFWVTQQQNGTTTTLLAMHAALGADGIPRERVHQIGSKTVTNAFQVDNFGRVTAESLDVSSSSSLSGDVTNQGVAAWMQSGARFRSYTLDGASNWQSWTDSQSGGDAPSLDARNAYMSFEGKQPLYDAADDAVSIPDATGDEAYSWDVYKHPLSVEKNGKGASFVYDGLGRRVVEQDASGTHYLLWDGQQLVARGSSRTDASGWTLEVGGADIDEHVASCDALGVGGVRIYHQTVDGSVTGVTGPLGLLESYTYSAYGEVSIYAPDGTARSDSAIGTRFLYHGQLFDPWTNTYSMRAREYRPAWGRFLSPDPIGLDGGLNLYAFTDGRPLHLRDPLGTHASENGSAPTPQDFGSLDQFDKHVVEYTDCSGAAVPSGLYCYGGAVLDDGRRIDLYGTNQDTSNASSDQQLNFFGQFLKDTFPGLTLDDDTKKAIEGASIVASAVLPILGIAGQAIGNISRALGGELGDVIPGLFASADEGAVGAGGEALISKGEQVTEDVVRAAMEDAPLSSQQAGGVSLPRIQDYVDRLIAGDTPPPIRVDGTIIVDGNHRYIAGRILGFEPEIQPWAGGRPGSVIPWDQIPIDPNAW